MNVTIFTGVYDTLRALSLSEADLSAGDTAVTRIASLKRSIDEVDIHDEPWAREWLSAEHLKAAVLFSAAKVNLNHEMNGQGTEADRRMRARIISKFNEWAVQAQGRLEDYADSSRQHSVVKAWQDELERFRDNPVDNM